MLSETVQKLRDGEAVWLPRLREAFARDPEAERLILRLCGVEGRARDFELRLPRAETEEEKDFLLRYVCANVFNLLSAYSAEALCFFGEPEREALFERLSSLFSSHAGYGKVLQVARRIHGRFSFRFLPLSAWSPAPSPAPPAPVDLAERLRAACAAAESRGCIGVDVGGSDIKLAVSLGGKLLCTREYDWNPAAGSCAEDLLAPIRNMVLQAKGEIECAGGKLDSVGLSFPDVVIADEIVGGETPKTKGMRDNPALDYETEFARLRALGPSLLSLCEPPGRFRMINDGSMAAFTAALELAAGGEDRQIREGVIAHSLGTDLGTGWLSADGTVPAIPLELYDLLLDFGSERSAALPAEDLRSTRNENSGMPGLRRYLGQAAAYRLAWQKDPGMLDGFTREEGALLRIPTVPEDLRKPCLERLMRLAEGGKPEAEAVFRQIGRHLGFLALEMDWLFDQTPPARFLFGRFVKSARCFELLDEGFRGECDRCRLLAADESLANSPLMRQLSQRSDVTVAQFGQAVGAIYYSLY